MYSRKAYMQTRVQTASPPELLLMLYDGLIRYVAETEDAIRRGSPADAGRANGKALDILGHLTESLRPDHAPELCENLRSLYLTWSQILVRSLAQSDLATTTSVREQIEHMRGCWSKAAEIAAAERHATAAAG